MRKGFSVKTAFKLIWDSTELFCDEGKSLANGILDLPDLPYSLHSSELTDHVLFLISQKLCVPKTILIIFSNMKPCVLDALWFKCILISELAIIIIV